MCSYKGKFNFHFHLNTLGIAVNSYKVHRDKYKEIISKTIPSISIGFESISFVFSIIVFFIKNFMDRKPINKAITLGSKILKIILIIYSFISIFILVKGFINLDDNSFLYNSFFYGKNTTDYTNVNRMNDLKKVKDISLTLYQEDGIEYFEVNSNSKIFLVNSSWEYIDYTTLYKETFLEDENIYIICLCLIEELLNIFSGLNWGSIETKVGKLIDTSIESRLEDDRGERNCFINLLIITRRNEFRIFSVVLFIFNIVYILIFSTFNKIEWLNNNITLTCWCLDAGIMFYYVIGLIFYFCDKKKRNGNPTSSQNAIKAKCSCSYICYLLKMLFILFILCGEFYTCILSFYAVYYSFKGNTFFYYYCYDKPLICEELFRGLNIDNTHLYYEDKYYFYYKIFLNKGSTGIFALSIIIRLIMLIWNVIAIANIIILSGLEDKLNLIKKVVYFIRNDDGTTTDLDDISIVEEIKGFVGNSAYNEDGKHSEGSNNNKKEENKIIRLKRVIKNKKSPQIINENINQNYNYNQNTNFPTNNTNLINSNQLNLNFHSSGRNTNY